MPIPQAEGEKSYLIERWSLNGFQYATLAATPLYAINAIRRGHFSIRGLARYNWVVPFLGAGAGGAGAMTVTSRETAATTASRTIDLRLNKNTVRQDDLQLVGSVVGALLLPAFFLKRVGLINGLLGGAGLGGAGGIITHYVKDDGAMDDLKRQSQKAVKEGEKAASEARRLSSEAKEKGKELANSDKAKDLTEDAKSKGKELIEDARQKGNQLIEKAK